MGPSRLIGGRGIGADAGSAAARRDGRREVTLIWFVVWLIADNWGGNAPLTFDPVNVWAGFLLLAVALDLSAAHARGGKRR